MAQTHSKRQKDIKSKLMAAVSMLLVSSIMMVSSTYAWFTLSTAPEVTGISTSVGANGNLEMALQPADGVLTTITSGAGDSNLGVMERNVTWGNLVDLGAEDAAYGLDKIVLYPAALNLDGAGKIDIGASILQTPGYGADGRVSELLKNTSTSTYVDNTDFPGNTDKGVRAIGVASGMTPRQLAYRNASSAANTAMNVARNNAAASLSANGKVLADVAIAHALATKPDSTQYTAAQVKAMKNIVDTLQVGVLDKIEEAYVQYIIAYTASAAAETALNDQAFETFYNSVKDAKTVAAVQAVAGFQLPAATQTYLGKLDNTKATVAEAATGLNALDTSVDTNTFEWDDISAPMGKLVSVDALQLNGTAVTELMSDTNSLIGSVLGGGGLNITMASGGGVYADVADHTGDFDVSITLAPITYNGLTTPEMTARMKTAGEKNPYLTVIGAAVKGAGSPASSGGGTMPLSEFYGYIVDLAFRTNAADSDLLLQVEPADRIYDDNAADAETRGHGSTMTFKSSSPDFSDASVKDLMENIRVVFFNTGDGTILANAKLDMSEGKVTTSADGVTAPIRIYTSTGATTAVDTYVESDSGTYGKIAAGQEYYEAVDAGNGDWNLEGNNWVAADPEGTGAYNKVQADKEMYVLLTHISGAYASSKYEKVTGSSTAGSDDFVADEKAEIMPLTQNTATALSVLVYLDGTSIQNKDVAALGSTSMVGTMNLQFASSANLVPMEYASLHTPGAAANP